MYNYIKNNTHESWEWHTTFIGSYMAHNYRLYYIIDSLFKHNNFNSIIEIGTGCGAVTTVLGLWGIKLDIPVMTIDIDDTKYDKKLFNALNISFVKVDEFSELAKEKICSFIKGPVLLICDGGLKKWEFNTFAPLVPKDSIIGIHDWGNECKYIDIEDIANKYCSLYQESRWDEMNVQFATFLKL